MTKGEQLDLPDFQSQMPRPGPRARTYTAEIFGEGAQYVSTLLVSPAARGLFTKPWCMPQRPFRLKCTASWRHESPQAGAELRRHEQRSPTGLLLQRVSWPIASMRCESSCPGCSRLRWQGKSAEEWGVCLGEEQGSKSVMSLNSTPARSSVRLQDV